METNELYLYLGGGLLFIILLIVLLKGKISLIFKKDEVRIDAEEKAKDETAKSDSNTLKIRGDGSTVTQLDGKNNADVIGNKHTITQEKGKNDADIGGNEHTIVQKGEKIEDNPKNDKDGK